MREKWIAPTKEASKHGFNRWDVVASVDDEFQTICTVRNSGNGIGDRQRRANLIAAGPDLLAALKEFHMHYGHNSPMLDKAWNMACDAIAKAEGNQ